MMMIFFTLFKARFHLITSWRLEEQIKGLIKIHARAALMVFAASYPRREAGEKEGEKNNLTTKVKLF
jgi:hypothetical protein